MLGISGLVEDLLVSQEDSAAWSRFCSGATTERKSDLIAKK
jgi:hypothetical protein